MIQGVQLGIGVEMRKVKMLVEYQEKSPGKEESSSLCDCTTWHALLEIGWLSKLISIHKLALVFQH